MASSIQDILEGIEERLKTINGLRVTPYAPDQLNPPQAIVGVPPIDYYETFGNGVYTLRPTITVLVSAAYDRAGQKKLAGYADPIGAASIFAAFRNDLDAVNHQTLGGTVDDCAIATFRPLGLEEVGIIGYYGGVFELEVAARGGA